MSFLGANKIRVYQLVFDRFGFCLNSQISEHKLIKQSFGKIECVLIINFMAVLNEIKTQQIKTKICFF